MTGSITISILISLQICSIPSGPIKSQLRHNSLSSGINFGSANQINSKYWDHLKQSSNKYIDPNPDVYMLADVRSKDSLSTFSLYQTSHFIVTNCQTDWLYFSYNKGQRRNKGKKIVIVIIDVAVRIVHDTSTITFAVWMRNLVSLWFSHNTKRAEQSELYFKSCCKRTGK